jgi:NTP pyrophosphatase (non-canonical NTP hydrolase)
MTIYLSDMNTFAKIRKWAEDRNLIEGSDPKSQMVKLMEEMGELANGIGKNKIAEIEDGIGDCCVVLTIIASQCGLTIEECIMSAYHEIKDRKGRMVDGIFIREQT